MPFLLNDIRKKVKSHLQDDAKFLTRTDVTNSITSGKTYLSQDVPLKLFSLIDGDGTQNYLLPVEFIDGISVLSTVETPTGQNPPNIRPRGDDWYFYHDPAQDPGEELRLRFRQSTPSATEKILVNFSTVHVLTVTKSTLNEINAEAVTAKALVFLFNNLAAVMCQTTDATIAADVVDRKELGDKLLFLATKWEKEYKKMSGLSEEVKPAQVLSEIDLQFRNGRGMLYHRKFDTQLAKN